MTTLAEQFQKAELITRLWATLVPDVPAPDETRRMRWVAYDDEVVVHAIRRAAKKEYKLRQAGESITAEGLYRFVDVVLSSEQARRKQREGCAEDLRNEVVLAQEGLRKPMVLRIINALTRHKCATLPELMRLCYVIRDGSGEEFAKAMQALHETQTIQAVRNRTGNDLFALNQGVQ